jgi:hypothetical protein
MEKDYLLLKRASASRPSGEWNDDDFDVLADGVVVGRSFLANAAPVGGSWIWTLLLEHHKDRTPTDGYEGDPRGGDGSLREELVAGAWNLWRGTMFLLVADQEAPRFFPYPPPPNWQLGGGGVKLAVRNFTE